MARPNEGWANLGPLKGTNSSDNPLSLGEGWATQTTNVVLEPMSALAVKRRGSSIFAGSPAEAYNLAYYRHSSPPSSGELWIFTGDGGTYGARHHVSSFGWGTIASQPTTLQVIRALAFNNKLFMAGLSGSVNRMYVYSGGVVRLVGLGVSGAPTVTNVGIGLYTDTTRYYKVDWVYVNAGATESRSELSPSVTFRPSGLGLGAFVTRPAILEHASHWRVWGSTDNVLFKKISGNIAVVTTDYTDTVEPAAYDGDFPEPVGTFIPPPSCTRIITDGHRLLMAGKGTTASAAGTGETAPSTTRVWYTPVLGSLDQGDDERIPHTTDQRNFLDIGDTPIGDITELDGPMEGTIYAFSRYRPWRLVPTGDVTTPYLTYPVTSAYGAGVSGRDIPDATAIGETDTGAPTLYFVDAASGMFRTAGESVQQVSYDIQNEIAALRVANDQDGRDMVFSWPEAKQTWWVISTGLVTGVPRIHIYVFHWPMGHVVGNVVRGGWTKWEMAEAEARVATIAFYERLPIGGGAWNQTFIPYLLQHDNAIYHFDRDAAIDGSTEYAASITAAPVLVTGAQSRFRVGNPVLVCTAHPTQSLRVAATRDFGTETRSADVSIAPEGTETRVVRTVEGLFEGDVTAVEITVGDAQPNATLWELDYLTFPSTHQQPR